jgi:hypothetical protein
LQRHLGNSQNNSEKGVVITLVAVFALFVLGAMAALSIDVVTFYTARSEAQLAADGAALAAARVVANSGATSDTTGTLLASVESSSGFAQTVAIQVVTQNVVGGVTLTRANITSITFGGTTTNPSVTVIVGISLPTFFARIWGTTQVVVSASATAEAYNPSIPNSTLVPGAVVAPICVKPWLLPNIDPTSLGNPIFVTATGEIASTAGNLLGYTTPPALGSTRLKLACGAPGTANPASCTSPLPTPLAWQYYPGNDDATSFPHPTFSTPACSRIPTPTNYQMSVMGCIQMPIACNSQVDIDQPAYPTRNSETAEAVNCLTHSEANGGDTVTVTSTNPPNAPFEFVGGADNPITGTANADVMVSDSLVTVPVFDSGSGVPPNPVTIVGFVQLFLGPQGLRTPVSGNMRTTVINLAGCGTNSTGQPLIIGNGASPVVVRLISPPS